MACSSLCLGPGAAMVEPPFTSLLQSRDGQQAGVVTVTQAERGVAPLMNLMHLNSDWLQAAARANVPKESHIDHRRHAAAHQSGLRFHLSCNWATVGLLLIQVAAQHTDRLCRGCKNELPP